MTNEEFKRGVVKTATERANTRNFHTQNHSLVQIADPDVSGEEFAMEGTIAEGFMHTIYRS